MYASQMMGFNANTESKTASWQCGNGSEMNGKMHIKTWFLPSYTCVDWRESISYRFSLIFDILNFALEIHWRYSLQSRRKKVEMKRSDTSEVNINKKFILLHTQPSLHAKKNSKMKNSSIHNSILFSVELKLENKWYKSTKHHHHRCYYWCMHSYGKINLVIDRVFEWCVC